ncbi:hypothetical protein EXIGLDRAFT_667735 [Exidia glandulosa HHB12029]|uniref:Asl1-like glycosyl hydrolase catalytic domain-containing protein n=1 Tax=Exidia glandulosa HHB12029 TaxID=1314781 RepID=A0A165N3B4_EXIGL|nr:hypothetical protein EXIGLDRAFT_667735 [Exidia glandulosa HHB12029]
MRLLSTALIACIACYEVASALVSRQSARKVGLAVSRSVGSSPSQWVTAHVAAVADFGPTKTSVTNSTGLPFLPTLGQTSNVNTWLSTLVQGYATLAIGLTEVDSGGTGVSVAVGISTWRQAMAPLKARGYQLCSHTVTQAHSGTVWLQSFQSQCPDCWAQVDFVCVEWFGVDAQDFINFVTSVHLTFGKDVIVTQFAVADFNGGTTPSVGDVLALMGTTTAFMDSAAFVHTYFWLGMFLPGEGGVPSSNGLMNSDGSPNALGLQYISS